MVPGWQFFVDFSRPLLSAIRVLYISDGILSSHYGHTKCGSMVDMQSATAEIRRGKNKKDPLIVAYIEGVYMYFDSNVKLLKAKFHYAIQVADLVADVVSDLSQTGSIYVDMSRSLEPVCDMLSTQKVASWSQTYTNLSKARSETGLRPG